MEKKETLLERSGFMLDLIRGMASGQEEVVRVVKVSGMMGEASEINYVVKIGDKPEIGLCELGGELNGEKLRKAAENMLMDEKTRNVVFFLICCGYDAILLNRKEIRTVSRRKKIGAERIEKIIEKLEKELFGKTGGQADKDEADKFIKSVLRYCRGISRKKKEAIRNVDIKRIEQEKESAYFTLDDKSEDELLKALLGSREFGEVCRYTSLDSLMRMMDEQKISLCSIVGMNDRSECDYAARKIGGVRDGREAEKMLEKSNSCFIMSCVEEKMKDDLTMWRLYGDDGKGVCMTFKVISVGDKENKNRCDRGRDDENFDTQFARVSYAKKGNIHPELDFIRELLYGRTNKGHSLRLKYKDVWEHFFKPNEYAPENEIRLLVRKGADDEDYIGRMKWIKTYSDGIICPLISFDFTKGKTELPLELKSVMLGPKCPESDINIGQLERYIKSQNLNVSEDFQVEKSSIKTYR